MTWLSCCLAVRSSPQGAKAERSRSSLNVSFSGGDRHESFEQSGASTARSFTEALVPIVEHIAHVIPQIAKIVYLADYLFELGLRQRANFAARSATGVANLEDSCELFELEADFERSPDKPDALDRFGRILPVARGRSLGAWQDTDLLIMAERIDADTAFTSETAGSHVLSINPGTSSGVKHCF